MRHERPDGLNDAGPDNLGTDGLHKREVQGRACCLFRTQKVGESDLTKVTATFKAFSNRLLMMKEAAAASLSP